MPACTSESLSNLWQPGSPRDITPKATLDSLSSTLSLSLSSSSSSSSPSPSPLPSPSTPSTSSPTSSSLMTPTLQSVPVLRRAKSANCAAALLHKQDSFTIKSDWREAQRNVKQQEQRSILVQFIGWYPYFLLQVFRAVLTFLLPAACIQTIITLPSLWISTWFWCLGQVFHLPLTLCKWMLSIVYTPSAEYLRKKRTVLIGGGSTIQALHLARNFYSAGARVVVCEVEGLFALARFSTAVNKFYTLPTPTMTNLQAYVQALCNIVEKENCVYYIPVNASSSSFYDATAKAMLELLGCTCFCPGVREGLLLDDNLEFLRRCVDLGLPTPPYYSVTSKSKLSQLYEDGVFRNNKFILNSCGPEGARDRYKMPVPASPNEFRNPIDISETSPWVAVEDVPGEHFVTCTTVKQSQVIANVTCRLDDQKCLIPIEHKNIDVWLKNFFAKLNLVRAINGHITFRFIVPQGNASVVLPFNCRVGVSLPYICHTSVHPRILWRPCKHFNRQNSGPLVTDKGRYWMHKALINTVQKPSVEALTRLIGTVLDKREALFVYWDPLPYCAYYHMQLPFKNILGLVHRRRFQHNAITGMAPVH